MSEPCYSMRLLRPFISVLRKHGTIPPDLLSTMEQRDPEERFPVHAALKLLQGAVELSGDEDLGLRAARESIRGDYAMLEYLAFSCRTAREGFHALSDYVRLLNDAASIRVVEEDGLAKIQFESSVPLIRSAVDFGVGVVHEVIKRWLRSPNHDETLILFRHARPKDIAEYEATFKPAKLVFQAPFDGFVIPAYLLDRLQPTADTRLHSLLRRCADQELGGLHTQRSFAQQVQRLLAKQLAGGRICADEVAASLQMSRRTLSRKLDREGTGFRALLDEMRRTLAARYLIDEGMSVADVAQRLGFAEVAAFHRAFKRWYGTTPHRYRTEYRRQASPKAALRSVGLTR